MGSLAKGLMDAAAAIKSGETPVNPFSGQPVASPASGDEAPVTTAVATASNPVVINKTTGVTMTQALRNQLTPRSQTVSPTRKRKGYIIGEEI